MGLLASSVRENLIIKGMLAWAFFTALTVAKTYPLISHFGTHIPSDLGDPLLNTWILAWNVHSLSTDPWNLFNANILYPVQHTLALSEHMIAVVPLFAPIYFIMGNPIFAYNTVFFLSFIFCGFTMFLLVHYWTGSFWASFLSGCLFAFAPIRFSEISHIQLLCFYWAPLAFIFLDRFVCNKRWKDLSWFAVFYWLQVLSSIYLGWLLTIASGVYILYSAVSFDRDLISRTIIPKYAAFIVISLLVLLPFYMPYFAVRQQWGFPRYLQDYVFYAADPLLSYFSPPPLFNETYLSLVRSHFPRIAYPRNQMLLFPGFVIGILVVGCSLPGATRFPAHTGRQLKWLFGLVCLVSFLFSLGPFLVVLGKNTKIPLPLLLFHYFVPGFQAVRVPARFALMAVFAASVLAGLGFLKAGNWLRARWHSKAVSTSMLHSFFALFWIGLFFLELGFKPLPLVSVPTEHRVPEVYRWLATSQINGPIVELPVGRNSWQGLPYLYMYFSTYHWLPLVNGVSGYTPLLSEYLASKMAGLPSPWVTELLSGLGVKGLILHTDQLEPSDASRWRHADLARVGLKEIARFGSDVVYELSPTEATPRLHLGLAIPDHPPAAEGMRLPAGAMMRFGLLAENSGSRLWAHSSPLGRTRATIKWEEVQTGKQLHHREYLALPSVIEAKEVWSTGVPVRIPRTPGRYRVSLALPALDLEAGPRRLEIVSSSSQTSADGSQWLSAAYALEEPSFQTIASDIIEVALHVTNTGQSIWLSDAKNERGKVRLGWRWYQGSHGLPFKEGREDLAYDIFPGQTYKFRTTIKAPLEPGEYTLELGLVCELLTWFADRGVPPLKLTVHIGSASDLSSP